MIRIEARREPRDFDQKVRKPGAAFLEKTPNPTSKEFRSNSFWKHASADLYRAYNGVCAYSCIHITLPPGTVDHFFPKSKRPDQAYEWGNYRLCLHKLNLYKGDSTDILDPFNIQSGWFVIDFPSCLVRPSENLEKNIYDAVKKTIDILKLNADDDLVQNRCDIMVMYAQGYVGLGYLERHYPFLWAEVVRQGIQRDVSVIFRVLNL